MAGENDSSVNLQFTQTGGEQVLKTMEGIVSTGAKVENTYGRLYDAHGRLMPTLAQQAEMYKNTTAAMDKFSASGSKTKDALGAVADSSKKAHSSFLDFNKSGLELSLRMIGIYSAGQAVVAVGREIIRVFEEQVKTAIKLSMEYQAARLSWGGLMGDMEKGAKIFDDIRISTLSWPTAFEAVEKASLRLKGFGIEGDSIKGILAQLGDAARGQGDELQRLALVYGQTFAQGKANARDLYQFIDAGVPIVKALADAMGRTTGEILSKMKTGDIKIAFTDIEAAITSMTEKGGLFYDQLRLFGESAQGQLLTATKTWKNELATLGDTFLPAITTELKGIIELVKWLGGHQTLAQEKAAVVASKAKLELLVYGGEKTLVGPAAMGMSTADIKSVLDALTPRYAELGDWTMGPGKSSQQDTYNKLKQVLAERVNRETLNAKGASGAKGGKTPLSGWQSDLMDAAGITLEGKDTAASALAIVKGKLAEDEAWNIASYGDTIVEASKKSATEIRKILDSLKESMYMDKGLRPVVEELQRLYKEKDKDATVPKKETWQSILGSSTGYDFTKMSGTEGLKKWGENLTTSRDVMSTMGIDVDKEYNSKVQNLIEKMLTSGLWTAEEAPIKYLEGLLATFPKDKINNLERLQSEAAEVQKILDALPQYELSLWDTEIPIQSEKVAAQNLANILAGNKVVQDILDELPTIELSLWDTELPVQSAKAAAKNLLTLQTENAFIQEILNDLPDIELSLWDTEIPIQSAKAAAKNLAVLIKANQDIQEILNSLPQYELSLWDTETPFQSDKANKRNLTNLEQEASQVQGLLDNLDQTKPSLWDTETPAGQAKTLTEEIKKNLEKLKLDNEAIQLILNDLPDIELSLWDTEIPVQSAKTAAKNLAVLIKANQDIQEILSALPQYKLSLWDTETPFQSDKANKRNLTNLEQEASQVQGLLNNLDQTKPSLWDTETPEGQAKTLTEEIKKNLEKLKLDNEAIQLILNDLPDIELSLWDTEIPVQSAKTAAKNLAVLIKANQDIQEILSALPQYELSLWDTETPFQSDRANKKNLTDLGVEASMTQMLLSSLDQSKKSLWETELPSSPGNLLRSNQLAFETSKRGYPTPDYGLGNIDLNTRPIKRNADGSISTVRSASFGTDEGEILLPTIGPKGEDWSNEEAWKAYKETGKYLGKFNSVEEANAYAEKLHSDQEIKYAKGSTEPFRGSWKERQIAIDESTGDIKGYSVGIKNAITDKEKFQKAQDELTLSLARGEISLAGYNQELTKLKETYDPAIKLAKQFEVTLLNAAGTTVVEAMKAVGAAMASGSDGFEDAGAAVASTVSSLLNQLPMLMLSAGLNILSSPGGYANPLGYALVIGSGLVALGVGAADYALTGDGGGTEIAPITAEGIATAQYAKGTNFAQGGWALVGEEGAELVRMPRGAAVIPHNMTKALLNAGVPGYASGLNVGAIFSGMSPGKSQINIYNQAGDIDITTTERTDGDGIKVIDQYITKKVRSMGARGELAKSMGVRSQGRPISRG